MYICLESSKSTGCLKFEPLLHDGCKPVGKLTRSASFDECEVGKHEDMNA